MSLNEPIRPKMLDVPLYLKTSEDMPRPKDAEFYLLAKNGMYYCRNHAWFQSDVKVDKYPYWLKDHKTLATIDWPRVPQKMFQQIAGFFRQVYQTHGSESIVLMLLNTETEEYTIHVPTQWFTTWKGWNGKMSSSMDIKYDVPTQLPPKHIIAMSIHCHCNFSAYSSWTDENDEKHRDGVHAVIGHILSDKPSFHAALAVDGKRFTLEMQEVFEPFERFDMDFPREWLQQISAKEEAYKWKEWKPYTPTKRDKYGQYAPSNSGYDSSRSQSYVNPTGYSYTSPTQSEETQKELFPLDDDEKTQKDAYNEDGKDWFYD